VLKAHTADRLARRLPMFHVQDKAVVLGKNDLRQHGSVTPTTEVEAGVRAVFSVRQVPGCRRLRCSHARVVYLNKTVFETCNENIFLRGVNIGGSYTCIYNIIYFHK